MNMSLSRKSRLRFRVRPRWLPAWWRMVDDGQPARTWSQQNQWALVLQSRRLPYLQLKKGQRCHFYVPPLLEPLARQELCGYATEVRASPALPPQPVYTSGSLAVVFFLLLLVWHGLHARWWEWSNSIATIPESWNALGALDVARVKVYHEWYRTVTALTLHADSTHILGNIAFGSIFLILLCRVQGLGLGLLLTVCGGALGNAANVVFRQGAHVSVGFSTALFAIVGALSGALMVQAPPQRGKALVPLAAGGAILAMLGTEGERTDYAAHLWGLGCGVLLGASAQWLRQFYVVPWWLQWLSGGVAVGLLLLCWWLAGFRF